MECINSEKILDYIEGNINSVESAMMRDHIFMCPVCKKEYELYMQVERQLLKPVEITPPPVIERNVLNYLFHKTPSLSSIISLIAASFFLLIVWIYIYFDFANNSIIQAIRLTSSDTSSWIGSVIKMVSSVFTGIYTVFSIINRFLKILLNVNIGVEIVGVTLVALFTLMLYPVFKFAYKKLRK